MDSRWLHGRLLPGNLDGRGYATTYEFNCALELVLSLTHAASFLATPILLRYLSKRLYHAAEKGRGEQRAAAWQVAPRADHICRYLRGSLHRLAQ